MISVSLACLAHQKSKFIQALYEVDSSSFGSLGRAEIRCRDFLLALLDSQHPIARYLECRWSPTMTSTQQGDYLLVYSAWHFNLYSQKTIKLLPLGLISSCKRHIFIQL